MSFFAHPNALIESGAHVGNRTRVWAFAHVLSGASIGEDCNICDHVFIEDGAFIGDRVTIKCGVQIWKAVRIENDVFVGPNATFTNDNFPRSRHHLTEHPETILEKGCSIGANATILPGVRIGQNAMVGAGAVVTRSVPPNAIVVGNPAQITGYANGSASTTVATPPHPHSIIDSQPAAPTSTASEVRGVRFHDFPLIRDLRGDLTVGEFNKDIPFTPKRYFIVLNVANREIRGEHAHRQCEQFLVCVSGSCRVVADDGTNRQEFLLNSPTVGLYLPAMIWATQYKYTSDAVLVVFASEFYDEKDYIRDYAEFLSAVGASK